MNATVIAVALSLVSAAAYASAAVAQARLAGRTEPDAGVLRLLGRGAWWSAVALNAGGALLHVAAPLDCHVQKRPTYGPGFSS